MTERSENNLTEIMDRAARTIYTRQANAYNADPEVAKAATSNPSVLVPAWDDLETFQQSQFKGRYLDLMMAVLDAADEVDGVRPTASQFAILTEAVQAQIDEDMDLVGVPSQITDTLIGAVRAIDPTLLTIEESS